MNSPKVSIIILNWNGVEDTIECLESLYESTYENCDVVLVDNGSEGDDVDIIRNRFGNRVNLIENEKNFGFAEGCNIGMRFAFKNLDPDYILLLNNDTTVDAEFLKEAIVVAENDPQIGIVGPRVYFYDEPDRIQSAGGRVHWWTGQVTMICQNEIDNGQYDELTDVDWISGCALLIKRSVIDDIGLLYSPYFAYFEEVDWCIRCSRAGYRVVSAPRSRVLHKRKMGIGRIEHLPLYYTTRNRLVFMRRHATVPQLMFFLLHFFLLNALTPYSLAIRQRDFGLLLSYYRGALDGFCMMLRYDRDD